MRRLRNRLARLLVGPFFPLTETGTWVVYHAQSPEYTVGMRVATFEGQMTTRLSPLAFKEGTPDRTRFEPATTGTFSGTFAA